MQEVAVEVHLAAIAGFFVEGFAEFEIRSGLSSANVTHNIEELFRREVVTEDVSVIRQVNHIEWVEKVAAVYIDAVVLVLEDIDDSRLCELG